MMDETSLCYTLYKTCIKAIECMRREPCDQQCWLVVKLRDDIPDSVQFTSVQLIIKHTLQ